MVHDHLGCRALRGDAVLVGPALLGPAELAGPEHQVLDDDLAGADIGLALDHGDAGPRRCLAGDGDEGMAYQQLPALHVDHAADLEDDDARALGLDRLPQRTRAGLGQRRHLDDAAAPAALGADGPAAYIEAGRIDGNARHLGLRGSQH